MLHVTDGQGTLVERTEGQPDVAPPPPTVGTVGGQVSLLPENRCECGCGALLGLKRRKGPPRRFASGACRQRVYSARRGHELSVRDVSVPAVTMRAPVPVEGFGGAVEYARVRADWSQAELAERLGVSRGWVAHVERNRRGVTSTRLREIFLLCGTIASAGMDDDGDCYVRE